jgi:hypothetical protein
MPEAAPVPVPVPEAAAPMGELFSQYMPGSPTDLFAPGYIKGFAPAEQAVDAWRARNRPMITQADLEATRLPAEWVDPNPGVYPGGVGPYGAARIPDNLAFGLKQGTIDPEALRVMAQGGPYDAGARRNAITARLQENYDRRYAADRSNLTNPWYVGPELDMEQYEKDPWGRPKVEYEPVKHKQALGWLG